MNPRCLLLAVLLSLGCDAGTVVEVSLQNVPRETAAVEVRAALNGVLAPSGQEFTSGFDKISVVLEPGRRGEFAIGVQALTASRCLAAKGEAKATIDGAPRVELALPLS